MNKKYLSIGQKLVPGIYGGMGPMAHIQFERHIVSVCKELGVTGDQFLPVWLTVSGSSTPDRTKSIQETGNSSLPHMVYFSRILKSMGADFIVATCNTAHYYMPYVGKLIKLPVVSLIDQTVSEVLSKHGGVKKVGLLATTGTLKTNLYQNALKKYDVDVISFSEKSDAQKSVMKAIYNNDYGIKQTGDVVSKKSREILTKSALGLVKNGAEIIIVGCTEISLAFPDEMQFAVVDPLKVLAKKVVALSLGYERLESKDVESRFAMHPPD